MNAVNNEVIHAREIQKQYQAHNIKTIEKCVSYDPKTKCRIFKKIEIDPNAEIFKQKFIKSKVQKEKRVNTKEIKPVKEPKKLGRPAKPKSPKKKIIRVNQKAMERRKKIQDFSKKGLTSNVIAAELKMSTAQVNRHLKAINHQKKDVIKIQHTHMLNKIKTFCEKHKTNLFYTSYNIKFKIFPDYNIRQLSYRLKLIAKSNAITVMPLSIDKKEGNCFRIFNKEDFSEEYFKD